MPRIWIGLLIVACACTRNQQLKRESSEEVSVLRYEGTPGYVGPHELAEDLGYLAPVRLEYIGNNATGGPHSIAAVVSDDVDIGVSFNGAVVKLVASKAPIKAVVAAYGTDEETYQGFYVLEESPIRSAKDLLGKKVSVNTLGAHVELVLKEFLFRNGLSAEQARQVTLVVLPASNSELALREKQVEVASLGLIFLGKALERGGIRPLFTDRDVFGSFNAGSFVMNTKFIAQNPNTVRKFVDAVGRAIDWMRSRPREEVTARMESIITRRKRNEDRSAVKYWRSSGVATAHATLADADFQRWIDWLVRDGQLKHGQVKPQDIFTNEFQPQPTSMR